MENLEPINVDFLINSGQVKADSEAVRRELLNTDATAEKSAKHVSTVVSQAYTQSAKDVNAMTQAVNQSNAAMAAQGAQVARMRPQFNGLNNSINQLSRELPAFAVSAQIGFLAISNNLPILADEINRLKAQNEALVASGQKSVPVWKQITGALLSWQTMLSVGITLITIYGRQIGDFIGRMFETSASIDKAKMSQEALNAALNSTDYKRGLQNVMELRNNFDLVRQGAMDSDTVLNQYNETLGKVLGTAEDLNEAERLFVSQSDAYVQALLYREAAQITARDTAAKMVELRIKEIELEQAFAEEQEASARRLQQLNQGFGGPNEDASRQAAAQRVQNAASALNALREETKAYIDSRNQLFQDFQRKSNSFGLKLDDTPDGSAISGRQSLLDQLAALDREYARKRLEDDEAEVQALQDKLTRIRELVERFNAANNTAQIAMGDVDEVGARAMGALLDAQAARRQAQEQKNLQGMSADLNAQYQQQQAAWQRQLVALRNYEQRRTALIAEYQELRNQLIADGRVQEAQELDRQHREELDALDDANVQKLAAYKELFTKAERLSRDAARQMIANARELMATQQMSEEMKARILQQIAALEQMLSDRNVENLYLIANGMRNLGEAFSEFDGKAGQAGEMMLVLADNMGALAKALQSEDPLMGGIELGLAALTNFIDHLAKNRMQLKQAQEDYYNSMIRLQNEYNLSINEQLRLQAELGENVFLTDYEGRLRTGAAAMLEAQQRLQEEMAKLSGGMVQTGVDKVYDPKSHLLGSMIGFPTAVAGAVFGKKAEKQFSNLLDTYPELVDAAGNLNTELANTLIASGLLDEATQQVLENIVAWQEQLEASREQMLSVVEDLASAMGGDIRNALVDAFREGEDAAKAMGDVIERVLENIVAQRIFHAMFNDVFEQFQNDLMADGSMDWTDEFGKFFTTLQALIPEFEQALKDAQDVANQMGLDLFAPVQNTTGSGLTGAIRRELTEQTASELAGLYRATFDVQKRHLLVSEGMLNTELKIYDNLTQGLRHQAATAENTAQTVARLDVVVTELKRIGKNTQPGSAGYDRGI